MIWALTTLTSSMSRLPPLTQLQTYCLIPHLWAFASAVPSSGMLFPLIVTCLLRFTQVCSKASSGESSLTTLRA